MRIHNIMPVISVVILSGLCCPAFGRQNFQYQSLTMTPEKITSENRMITLKNLPDPRPENATRLKNATPLTERLWNIALSYLENNVIDTADGPYLTAGTKRWGQRVYTRDIAFSGVFGLNRLYPQLMWNSLKITRKIRKQVGFNISNDLDQWLKRIDVPWKLNDISEREFLKKYKTNGYHKRTDDVVWVWHAIDWLKQNNADIEKWQWAYEEGKYFFDKFYRPFYDEKDGLFRGQSAWIDIGWGYPQDWPATKCVLVKAASTNCLYYKAFLAMAEMAEHLELAKESEEWNAKAKKLKQAIRDNFIRSDGSIIYFKGPDAELSKRQNTLATAFPVLFGILNEEESAKALRNYPVTDIGVPVIYPFYPHNPSSGKYRTQFFSTTFFLKAKEIATGKDYTALNAALVGLGVSEEGYFYDWIHFSSKKPGSAAGWSAASLVDVYFRAGLVDLEKQQ